MEIPNPFDLPVKNHRELQALSYVLVAEIRRGDYSKKEKGWNIRRDIARREVYTA